MFHITHRQRARFLVAVKLFSTFEQQSLHDRIDMRCATGHHLAYVPRTAHVDLRRLRVAAAKLHLNKRAVMDVGRKRVVVCMRFFQCSKYIAWQLLTGGLFERSITTHACHQPVGCLTCGLSHSHFLATAVHKSLMFVTHSRTDSLASGDVGRVKKKFRGMQHYDSRRGRLARVRGLPARWHPCLVRCEAPMHQAGSSRVDPSPRLTLQPPPEGVDTLSPQQKLPPKPVIPPGMVVMTGNAVNGRDGRGESPKRCQRCSYCCVKHAKPEIGPSKRNKLKIFVWHTACNKTYAGESVFPK